MDGSDHILDTATPALLASADSRFATCVQVIKGLSKFSATPAYMVSCHTLLVCGLGLFHCCFLPVPVHVSSPLHRVHLQAYN